MKEIIAKRLSRYQTLIKEIAQETGFVQRRVKLTPQSFVNTISSVNSEDIMSDENLCRNLKDDYAIDIKRQVLNKRLHQKKVWSL